MAKLTPDQKKKAKSLKDFRGAERRLAAKDMAAKEEKKKKLPNVTERTKGITNIIKKRASQAERAFKGSK